VGARDTEDYGGAGSADVWATGKAGVDARADVTSTGHRPRTIQRLTLDAEEQGALTTVEHRTMTETSPVAHFVEPAGMTSRNLYATPHAVIAPTNLATPCFMRAPGEASGMFALESAIDEMAEKAGMDPLAFRLRNYAEIDLQDNRP